MWIKICANTTLEDAQLAIDLGADAVGFVFAPSTRRVPPLQAGQITARLRGNAERIGVFHDLDFEGIREAVAVAGLTGVQLHGPGPADLAPRLRAAFGGRITIAQTLHWAVDQAQSADTLARRMREIEAAGAVDRVLVDSQAGSALGGTGRSFAWDAARELFAEAGLPMIVAGGLGPANVAEAIERLLPWGVDVASGVELVPGRKDPERLRQFIVHARAAGESPIL